MTGRAETNLKIDYNSPQSFIEAHENRNGFPTERGYFTGTVRVSAGRTEVGARMLLAGGLQSSSLDMPTLSLVAVCIAGLLGLFLIIDWMQQRNVRALAWWGSAYLIGASAMALGNMPPSFIKMPLPFPVR